MSVWRLRKNACSVHDRVGRECHSRRKQRKNQTRLPVAGATRRRETRVFRHLFSLFVSRRSVAKAESDSQYAND
jgi:hypothetical protein